MLRIAAWTLMLPVGVILALASVQGQVGLGAAPALPRTLEMLRAGQPGFETALDVDYPGVRNLDGFEAIKPFVAILHNRTGHGIKAYVVRWVVVDANGRNTERKLSPMSGGGREALPGEEVIWTAGQPRLVTPMFNWNVSPFEKQDRAHLLSALAKGPLAVEAAMARSIDISIDAVVYDDGVFLGPDAGDFFDRYECDRNGAQDEGALAFSLLELNVSDDEIMAQLRADVEKGLAETGKENRGSLLNAARGKEAQVLLFVFKNRGRSGLKSLSLRLGGYKRTDLQRK